MTTDLREQLQRSLGDAYRLERELGGGGMSRVFLAVEMALGRNVVVKVLLPELAAGVSVDRFRREIQLAAKLQHPHIVPLLAAGESAGLPYFTMPFVVGESLRRRLLRDRELPVPEAIRLLRDVASALDYAHGQGIVHRDIKPDNVLLTHRVAVVTDFGVAKALSASGGPGDPAHPPGLTTMGVALGTPTYMAPEQASGDPGMDHRVDVYAFGIMAYEMMAGQPPFAGRSPQAILGAHLAALPDPVTSHRPGLPPALAALIMHCLAKHPADRPQTAGDLIVALDMLTTPSGGTIPVAAVTVPVPVQRHKPTRGQPRRLVPIVAGIGGAAVLGLWVWASRPAEKAERVEKAEGAETAVRVAPVAPVPPADTFREPARTRPKPEARRPPAEAVRSPNSRADLALLARLREEARSARRRATEASAPSELIARGDTALARAESLLASRRVAEAAAELSVAATVWRDAASAAQAPADPPTPPEVGPPSAPAPNPPPAVATPRPAAPPPAPPDPGPPIRALFDGYAAAVETRSLPAIRQAYPGLRPEQAREWERFFSAVDDIQVALQVTRLDVRGDTGEASLAGVYVFTDPGTRRTRRDSVTFLATLRRDARGWRIESLR